ncbi:hypothetical protein [Fibrobacter succinogenes]|uniref:hypothetical protein n=1 Tax=Fibrobacter succinogenes TaxID=833 RepID=UPI001569758D|nr:hypothetical protein [Fibrobacter succinogenes]
MSGLTLFGIITTILQSIVLVVIIAKTVRLMDNGKNVFLPFFFMLAMTSFLLSNMYWIAYDVLKPDTRMPIAANEIGECAMILLLSAGLDVVLKDKKKIFGEIVFAILFIGVNIALWIAWSGEWLQDVLFGIPYIYFLWLLIRGMRSRGVLARKELWLAAVMGVSVLILQIPLLYVKGFLFESIKVAFFVVMFALMAWLGVKSFRSKDYFMTLTFFLWTELSMFLTSGVYYYLAFSSNVLVLPLMYVSMKRELANDLC